MKKTNIFYVIKIVTITYFILSFIQVFVIGFPAQDNYYRSLFLNFLLIILGANFGHYENYIFVTLGIMPMILSFILLYFNKLSKHIVLLKVLIVLQLVLSIYLLITIGIYFKYIYLIIPSILLILSMIEFIIICLKKLSRSKSNELD